MKLPRRQFLQLTAGSAALLVPPRVASALDYPARPVHILLGFPPGGSSDIIGRLVAQWLSERMGQPFIFDNRPGAPDGYTLLWVTSPNTINATLYHLDFNFIHDIAPVIAVFRVPNVLEVNPAIPVKTVGEFIAYAKANPGKLNFASGGIGSTPHLAAELFKFMTGVDMRHVPYRGSAPALVDLLSGQVQVMFDLLPASIGYIRGGKLRALAVTTATRSNALPELPTVGETVSGYEASTFNGVGVPSGTPTEIIDTLNKQINATLADPAIKTHLANLGAIELGGSPGEFGKFIAAETDKWAKVINFAGIKPE